ncbi:MAG: DUF2807 domain-containing protein [Saprospiraceae bacterium]|nr:DUF2807 domain-containing protein [Saprospiraceae bacterium]
MKTSNKLLISGLSIILTLILTGMIYLKSATRLYTESGSKEIIKKEDVLSSFSGIQVTGNFEIRVHKGEFKYIMEGNRNIIENLTLQIKNNTLYIEPKSDSRGLHIRTSGTIKIDLYSNELNKIQSTGNSNIEFADSFETNNAEINAVGNGGIHSKWSSSSIKINLTGNGEIINHGKSENLELTLLGNGDINFTNSPSEQALVSLTGNGSINLTCNKSLDAKLLGNGNIQYKGQAQLTESKVGNGEIIKEDE